MTSEEFKEVLELLAEYAQTEMLCIGYREKELIKKYAEIMSGEKQANKIGRSAVQEVQALRLPFINKI